jgi:hypothetical protein
MSDKALGHAIYLSKISGAEIVILNVIEDVRKYTPTSILATMKGQAVAVSEKTKNDLEITMEGQVKQMMDERMRLCKTVSNLCHHQRLLNTQRFNRTNF